VESGARMWSVWHYLYHSTAGHAPCTRGDGKWITVTLVNSIKGQEESYMLSVDDRDPRVLVAFDGYLLAGSPRRKGTCVSRAFVGTIQVPKGQFYAIKNEELGIPPYIARSSAEEKIVRRLHAGMGWLTDHTVNLWRRVTYDRAEPPARAKRRDTVLFPIYRYFLLLREGTFVFGSYDDTNMASRYLVAEVNTARRGENVEWRVGG